MAGQFTVVVAVVALVAARLGLGTARPAADFEPPHRLLVAPRCVWSTKPGTKPTPAYRVRWFYKTPSRW